MPNFVQIRSKLWPCIGNKEQTNTDNMAMRPFVKILRPLDFSGSSRYGAVVMTSAASNTALRLTGIALRAEVQRGVGVATIGDSPSGYPGDRITRSRRMPNHLPII